MIQFKSILYKNFLSTGEAGIKVDFDTTSKTLIVGKNGSGKSTVIESICFALFGRAFREINKPQLVNSINKKNCLVIIHFSIGKEQYKIIRGIKPNKFEIYKDDKLLNQEADNKDYQKILEKQILKMNFKTFTQIVVLGSSSYVPFMKLTTADRRAVIEDILDIKIFTMMNKILKERIKITKEELSSHETKLELLRGEVESQKKIIKNLIESKDNATSEVESNIQNNLAVINELTEEVVNLQSEIEELSNKITKKDTLVEKMQEGKSKLSVIKSKSSSNQDEVDFFNENDNCSVCKQSITKEHKHSIVEKLESEINKSSGEIDTIESWLVKAREKMIEYDTITTGITRRNSEVIGKNSTVSTLNKQIEILRNKLKVETIDDSKIDEEKSALTEVVNKGKLISKERDNIAGLKTLQDLSIELLKDTAIKAAIVKEYLPVINKLINKHLSDMEFYANFELTENFEEVIKSRNRDEFSYSSFSEGEKFRIDLAILFTWRSIAKLKNSLNTNLLMFDEVLDGVVDASGISFFLEYLETLKDTNTFVISHNDKAQEHFERIISFEKKGDFTVMEEK